MCEYLKLNGCIYFPVLPWLHRIKYCSPNWFVILRFKLSNFTGTFRMQLLNSEKYGNKTSVNNKIQDCYLNRHRSEWVTKLQPRCDINNFVAIGVFSTPTLNLKTANETYIFMFYFKCVNFQLKLVKIFASCRKSDCRIVFLSALLTEHRFQVGLSKIDSIKSQTLGTHKVIRILLW